MQSRNKKKISKIINEQKKTLTKKIKNNIGNDFGGILDRNRRNEIEKKNATIDRFRIEERSYCWHRMQPRNDPYNHQWYTKTNEPKKQKEEKQRRMKHKFSHVGCWPKRNKEKSWSIVICETEKDGKKNKIT